MSTAPEITRASPATVPAARPPAALGPLGAPALARRLAGRLGGAWLPRAAWTIGRTGPAGLVGIALLLAAALFLLSTHLQVAGEVDALRAELAAAQGRPRAPAVDLAGSSPAALAALPERAEVPALLGKLFEEARGARLAIDTARYEVRATASGAVVRYQLTFPVTGSYPQIRDFVDAALAGMPALALSRLALERKSIGDGAVEAQIQMTLFTRSDP